MPALPYFIRFWRRLLQTFAVSSPMYRLANSWRNLRNSPPNTKSSFFSNLFFQFARIFFVDLFEFLQFPHFHHKLSLNGYKWGELRWPIYLFILFVSHFLLIFISSPAYTRFHAIFFEFPCGTERTWRKKSIRFAQISGWNSSHGLFLVFQLSSVNKFEGRTNTNLVRTKWKLKWNILRRGIRLRMVMPVTHSALPVQILEISFSGSFSNCQTNRVWNFRLKKIREKNIPVYTMD